MPDLICKSNYNLIDNLCYSTCGDKIVTYDEQCDDGNLIYGDGCHFCQFTCQDSCLNCIQGICYYCQEGYQLIQSKCLPICGDGVKANDEQCEIVDQSLIVFRCLNCKYECDINCQICLFGICQICQVGYFMSSNKQICNLDYLSKISENNFKCNDYCLSCVNGICGLCFEGRYLFNDECIQMNLQNGIYVDVSSLDSCGDFKININEECEDNNINPFLSCLNCKFQCDFYCINCLFGKCQGCQFGYIVNDNFKCQPECGDGIVVPFQDEQCDIQDDGCLNCKFKCQPYCIKCDLHYCFECETGYQVDQLNLNFCILASFCGDGVIDQEFEDCDDQNDKPYDGCFQCKFQCESNCQECQQGICQKDICSSGTIWRNNSCISIVIDNCEIQEEGNCISCKTKYDLINNQCVLTKNNNLNTESSNNYLCRESECAFSKSPYMSLLFLNQTFALQFVQVNFDQQVRLNNNNSNQKQAFNISILNLDESYYSISVIPIQEFSFDLQFVQYEIIIKFLLSFETKPILQLQLNQEIVNSYNQKIDQYIQSISLQQPIIISEQDKQSSFQLQKYNKGLMIGTISICFLCLFSQGFIFVETLNFLQYQSFLRFINVEYPENLFIYYQAQEMLSIDNYLEFLYINEYLEILTGKDQTIKSNGKLQLFNIEVDLLTHIFPQFLQVISLVIFIITFKKVWPLLYQFQIFIINKFPQFFQSPTNRVAKIIILYLGKINKNIKKQIYWCLSFSLNSIRTFLIINQWDLLFKVILCYNHIQINNIRTLLQILFSTLILCSYIYFIFKAFYQCIPKKNHDHKLRLDFNFMVFNFCRTISFHLFLIILQDQFVLQCLSLSINNFSQCIIIYKYFQCNKFEKIALVINEGFLSIFTITQLVYLKQGFFDISSENIVRIGFFHVYLLLFTLAITLIKQCLPIFNKFVQLIRKK
ncbi:unnamed protein product [Paramecium sonneborni]|uniref:Transmembrane protein n=1 Tax=Paramecium sonneborni TaxID=65129 RepID=A0A8S1MBU0_9CILI|nr:unnamed protein product [Paramecium sonneborni]